MSSICQCRILKFEYLFGFFPLRLPVENNNNNSFHYNLLSRLSCNFYKRKHSILTKYFCITFQDALDRENHSSSTLKNAISNGSLDQVQNNGCLPQCISVDIRRRPISALAANSFWSGVSEIKDVLTTGKFGKYWIYLG